MKNESLTRACVSVAVGALLLVGSTAAGITAASASAPTTAPSVVPAVVTGAPALQLSTTSGYQGQPVTVTGTGFTPNTPISLTTDKGYDYGTYMTDGSGAVSAQIVISGAFGTGLQTITAADGANGTFASADFTVLPTAASVSPASGTRGSAFTVSGAGYNTGETLTLSMGGIDLGSIQIAGAWNGTFSFPLTVPEQITAGPQAITVLSDQRKSQDLPFTVLAPAPSLTISPDSGVAGATFTVTSAGYIPGETEQILFGPNNDVLLQFTVNSDAPTAYQVMVPNNAATGANTVTTVGSRTTAPLSARYTVTAATHPAIAISTDKGPVGTRFVISGTGYTPGLTATATFGTGGSVLGSAVAGTDGTFRIDATIPAAAAGTQDIVVTAPGTTGLSAPFAVQAAAAPVSPVSTPAAPAPAAPAPVSAPAAPAPASDATPADGSTAIPAADSTATRGLNIQTATQPTPAAPSNGPAMIFWLCGSLVLSLAATAAVALTVRKRRA